MTLLWSEDRQVQHSLQFFIRHSAPQLSGYFDSPFWQQMLLQSGFQSPAVTHAIAAIGALHEKLLAGADKKELGNPRKCSFALEQCNQSIQHLTKPIDGSNPDLKLLLTTCILMGAFAAELSQVSLMMKRLQTQKKGLLAKHYLIVGEDLGVGDGPPSAYFETLQEARISLAGMINQHSIFFLDLDLNDDFYEMIRNSATRCSSQAAWLEAWERAFSQLLARKQTKLTPSERRGAMVLKAHHLVCEILSNVDFSKGTLGWDRFQSSFTAIADLAEAVLEASPESTTSRSDGYSSNAGTKLCFSLGILDPLYEVCARCRDPLLRRRALDLLTCHPRQECFWGSWSAWKVGKYLLRLEEETDNSPQIVVGDAGSDHAATKPFNSNSLPVSANDGACRVLHRRMSSHSPREALNPGLFAGSDCLMPRG
jgi:hypothetical protein